MNKQAKIIGLISVIAIVMSGTAIGIWLGISNSSLGPHPDEEWQLVVSGNLETGAFNLTIKEIIELPSYKDKYIIRGSTTTEAIYQGISLKHFFENQLMINQSVTTVTFRAEDDYSIHFSLEEIIQDEANLLAYARNGEYLTNQTVGGTGYLRLIIPPKNDSDFNGPLCLKWIAEIIFS